MTELAPRIRRGVVGAFDEASGLGAIIVSVGEGADDAEVAFHCIGIADGSRTIAVGAPVTFALLAKLGRYEATDIRPV